MNFVKQGVLTYRNHTHTCVPSDKFVHSKDQGNPMLGPTVCKNGHMCYAFPRSVTVEPCLEWLHACMQTWSEEDWAVFIKEWARANGSSGTSSHATTSSWSADIQRADIAWFPVRASAVSHNEGMRKRPTSLGFIFTERCTK